MSAMAEVPGESPSHRSPGIPASHDWAALQGALVGLLRSVAGAISRLTPEEFEALLSGHGRLAYVGPGERVSRGRSTATPEQPRASNAKQRQVRKRSVSPEKLKEIEQQLVASPDRESARSLLEHSGLKRDDLRDLARSLAIPLKSRDTIETIRFKLVEGVVGARLRSEALRRADVR